MRRAKKLIAGLSVLALFGLVGQMDFDDAVAQEAHCLAMVEDGHWPAEVCE